MPHKHPVVSRHLMTSIASSDSEDFQSDVEEINIEERVRLSDRIALLPHKSLTEHGNVIEGQITNDIGHDRSCAIKFVRSQEQTVKEVEALRKLSCHSHVITLLTSGTYRDLISEHSYIALEKCHERNLRQHLLHRKQTVPIFDVNWALNFCRQIIDGMTFVHEKLIIHKDLKPSNILLTHDLANIKIADFGSSQILKTTSSMVYCPNMFGTLGFRPPESFGGMYVSLKSDSFALGALFYFLLSNGESPFGDQMELWDHNVKHGTNDVVNLKVPNPKTTGHLIKLLLAHDRRRRPSIWQIAAHPCWYGEECDCDFDYGILEEDDDDDVTQESQTEDDEDEEDHGLRIFVTVFRQWQAMKDALRRNISNFEAPQDSVSSAPEEIFNSELIVGKYLRSGYQTYFYGGKWKNLDICIEEDIPIVPESVTIFERKLRALTELRHQNVVRLLAATINNPRRLVLELTDFKHFRSFLQEKKNTLTINDHCNYASQIADGMSYISSKNYVHGCLCASGILIGANGTLKISRFRLIHRIGENVKNWKEHIRVLWTAPEVLSSGKFSKKSDVWSFGIVLYEIFSDGSPPYKYMRRDEMLVFLMSGQRLTKPPRLSDDIFAKMLECWDLNPSKRPEFSDFQSYFKYFIEESK